MNLIKFFFSIIRYGKKDLYLLYFLLLGLVITGFSISMLSLSVKKIIDSGFLIDLNLTRCSLHFIFFSVLLSFGTFVRVFCVNLFSEKLCSKIKENIYEKLLHFSIPKYDKDGYSIWINFITNDIDAGITAIKMNLSLILRNITMFIGAVILLFSSNWRLSLVVIGVIPIIMIIISIFGYKLRNKIFQMKEKKNGLFLHFNETISFIKTVQASNGEHFEINKLQNLNQQILSFALPLFLLRGFFLGLMFFLMLSSIAVVIYFGGKQILTGAITIGSLSSFIFQSIIAASAVGGTIESISEITKHQPIFQKIQEMMNFSSDSSPIEKLLINNPNITFKNLSFAYLNNNENYVLQNFNLEIKAGEKIAIIGQSGSGKSTITNLLLRFYEDYSGEIFLSDSSNKQEIRSINIGEYRNIFGLVQQDMNLFSDSLLQNLTYGCEAFDQKLLDDLIDKLELRDFIDSLPDKLQTKIGDKSLQISGGQKQRIAIIRSLIRKPQILIFDESSSGLDQENEKKFYDLLFSQEYSSTTIIFITHRMSYLDKMDKIINIEDLKTNSIF